MKKLAIMVFISWISMSMLCISAGATDKFPKFDIEEVKLYVPIDDEAMPIKQEDIEHQLDINFLYTAKGQVFSSSSEGHIQTLSEGFSGLSERSTPWMTLTELLAAFQQRDLDAVKALYTDASQGLINEWLADSEIAEQFTQFMKSVIGIEILLGFEYKEGFLAVVTIDYGRGNEQPMDLTPYYFVRSGSEYLLSTVTLDDAMSTNISIFLQLGHPVEELLQPVKDRKHTLTVEKSGTGNGQVLGSGIDCGEDCIEIYDEGKVVFLKAVADEDSELIQWLVNGEPIQGRIEMHEDMTVTAIFNKK